MYHAAAGAPGRRREGPSVIRRRNVAAAAGRVAPAVTVAWTLLLAAAVAWPSHVLGMFDGIPFNGRAEAVAIGVVLPALWWLDRAFLRNRTARICIATLLIAKLAATVVPQQGWCARFTTTAPLTGDVMTMRID